MRSGLIGALLVLALYGSYHFDVIGFELTSNNAAPDSKAPVVSGIASSKAAASTPIVEIPATKTPVPVTATRVPESTATPLATATVVATSTPEPDDEDIDSEDEDTVELTALAPEPTSTPTPEPTATPTPVPTEVPATPTPTTVPPTATVAVALGVVVTPSGGSAPAPTATPANTALRAAGPVAGVGAGPWTGDATPFHSSLAGNTMGCGEVFNPLDPTILAVGYALDTTLPCGASVQVCGSTSVCLTMVRKDTCPGCPGSDVDLSRAAFDRICGTTASRCTVTIKKL